jgi:hypothetical protein
MRIFFWIAGLLLALPACGAELHFDFGDYPEGATPTNFQAVLAGEGQPPLWKVITAEAPSAFAGFSSNTPALNFSQVLAQTSTDPTDEHFPMLLYSGERFRKFTFTTRFKIVSGVTEQMAGVVFRYQNASNYYVVRANAVDNNVRFYKVVDGQRSTPIGPDVPVAAGVWHSLGVQCEGNQIVVSYEGKPLMPALGDNTFTEGQLGFRTKSDAVCYFTDSLVDYTPIVPGAQTIVDKVLELEPQILGLQIYTAQTNGAMAVIASKNKTDYGQPGAEAEAAALKDGTVSFAREKNAVLLILPLHDRNGDFIAAVRLRLKSFLGETQDTAVNRARMVVNHIQDQVLSESDLQ